MSEMPIGVLARQTACNVETIRYYERIGILPAPRRGPGGYRRYSAEDARRLVFIRRARELGFSLEETRTLLRLAAVEGEACRSARDLALAHLHDVAAKIADLKAIERRLARTVRQCRAGGRPDCPVIASLSSSSPAVSTGPHVTRRTDAKE